MRESIIAILGALGIAIHLLARFAFHASATWINAPLLAVLILGGSPLLFDLVRNILKGQFGADLLAGMSILVSLVLGEYLAGAIVVLMLSGGSALENYASRRASAVLAALAKRMPNAAHRRQGAGEIVDIELGQVLLGDTLLVFPHEICPVDGLVTEGHGSMDESYLTGEPFQIAKAPGANVLSGAVNGEGALTVTVSALPSDSRYSKIMQVMRAAEANRPRFRRLADRIGAWYTPLGVAIAGIGWLAGHDPSRFLAVLVIATPCPLLIAIPIAIIGAVSAAAARGIIIKNPAILETIDTCRTVILDKTGTLTLGKPVVTEILTAQAYKRADALRLAASLEQYSKHPLAVSLLEAARAEGIELDTVESITEKPGIGLSGRVAGAEIQLTGRRQVAASVGTLPPQAESGMECLLLVNRTFAAAFRFQDAPRPESRSFVEHLGPRHQVRKVMIVSGDREAEVRHLAAQVRVSDVLFGVSPEQKLAVVRAESALAPTLFLGDGINDAPAMQAATVGIAFGSADGITAEAADAVVLEPSLAKVDDLIHIGRRMRRIALQSAIGGMALSFLGMLAAAAGYLPPVAGAVAQEIIDVAALLNALRMALPTGRLDDMDARGPNL